MESKTRNFVDQVVNDDNIEAGESFKTIMQDKQLDAIDLKRVEMQLDWMNNEPKTEED
jgi:hypothetical protein